MGMPPTWMGEGGVVPNPVRKKWLYGWVFASLCP